MKCISVVCACLIACGCAVQKQEISVTSRAPVASDAAAGASLHLDDAAQIVTAQSKDGHMLWSVDIIKACGVPAVGEPKIRSLTIRDGKVHVVFGKHDHATIDLKTGEVEPQGAD